MAYYHDDMRALQDRYEGRAVADRLETHRMHRTFSEADRALIEGAGFFFLATASEDSVDCSFKGGAPGFVKITGPATVEFPDYDGNRMYRSLGNIKRSARVGLLFLDFAGGKFDGSAARMRINGLAEIDESPEAAAVWKVTKEVMREKVDVRTAVPGFEAAAEEFLKDMAAQGCTLCTCAEVYEEPLLESQLVPPASLTVPRGWEMRSRFWATPAASSSSTDSGSTTATGMRRLNQPSSSASAGGGGGRV